jgi:chromosome segregation ATPase
MNQHIWEVIGAFIGGGGLTTLFTYLGKRDSSSQLVNRESKLAEERDKLYTQVVNLQSQVRALKQSNEELTLSNKALKKQVEELTTSNRQMERQLGRMNERLDQLTRAEEKELKYEEGKKNENSKHDH